jgi:predicted MFS family arabinose efflux permease
MITGSSQTNRVGAVRLYLLFGALYFVQGIAEPTEGLIAQPVRSLLTAWGRPLAEVAAFSAVIGLPWTLKPLYGLLTDFVPLFGRRRKSYLLVMTRTAAVALGCLAMADLSSNQLPAIFWCLLAATLGFAFSDVVIDALMIERGQPAGLTGRLQSVQWAAMYSGAILAGRWGGQISQNRDYSYAFAICAAAIGLSFVVCLLIVREPSIERKADYRLAVSSLVKAMRLPVVWSAGAFLFLLNFNPFLFTVMQLHMTGRLKLSEEFYGDTITLRAAASVAASVAYGFYCRRVPFRALLHSSIALGIASTLAYWLLIDTQSAVWISLAAGFAYMSATLVQLDLAARVSPLASAGTVFALLMALSNLSMSASDWLGGLWYTRLEERFGAIAAFNLLVGIGAVVTASCWCLLPLVKRTLDAVTPTPGRHSAA